MSRSDEPMVGIFWLYGERLVIDCTPLSQAERYGDCYIHPRGHLDWWTELQRRHAVPGDLEYEDPPRGRVHFNTRSGRFLLLADACILNKLDVVHSIITTLHLPPEKTDLDHDLHYRCNAACRNRANTASE